MNTKFCDLSVLHDTGILEWKGVKRFRLHFFCFLHMAASWTAVGQEFVEDTTFPFTAVDNSAVALIDVENDGDLDVLITGTNSSDNPIARFYRNNGIGVFAIDTSVPFERVSSGIIAIADVDNDGDEDVLIAGLHGASNPVTKLYINNGAGTFTEDLSAPFPDISSGDAGFFDADGDGDQDLLLTGLASSSQEFTGFYTNDGSGTFTEDASEPFDDYGQGATDFSDVDGDGDLDVLITGRLGGSTTSSSVLYLNDGAAGFTQDASVVLDGVMESTANFVDVDMDGDEDILITGINNSSVEIARLYLNESGTFTEDNSQPFTGVGNGAVTISDTDGDGDPDVLITGRDSGDEQVTEFYVNDGSGGFTEDASVPFTDVDTGDVALGDLDNDGDLDLLLTGRNSLGNPFSRVYRSNRLIRFMEQTNTSLAGVESGAVVFADVDNDDDQDVLLVGENTPSLLADPEATSRLYLNDGFGGFAEDTTVPFESVSERSTAAFADIDNDGDEDVIIAGQNEDNTLITQLYKNNGMGGFTQDLSAPFEGVIAGTVSFADVDNDNDEDVLITGVSGSATQIAKLYVNDGMGAFTEDTSVPFTGVQLSAVAFADVDGDADQDLVITGQASSARIAKIYLNNGLGQFTEDTSVPFVAVADGAVAFADVDGDLDQDLLISGIESGGLIRASRLYINDGTGGFTEDTSVPFIGISNGSAAFADVNNDGDQDLLLSGFPTITRLYTNDGSGNFTETTISIAPISKSSFGFADLDDDNDLDVLICGNPGSTSFAGLYENNAFEPLPISLPVELLNFTGREDGKGVSLQWQTAVELNNDFFEVQHSPTGELGSFQVVGSVSGHGDSDEIIAYQLYHENPVQGFNYYRLRQVDYGGAFEFSPTILVSVAIPDDFDFTVYPNPIGPGRVFFARLTQDDLNLPLQLHLYDLSGSVIAELDQPSNQRDGTVSFQLPDSIRPGLYFLSLNMGNREAVHRLFVE